MFFAVISGVEFAVATYEAAEALIYDRYPDAEIGHAGDLSEGGDRTLAWASHEDSVDDDGRQAVGSIRRVA